MGRQKLRFADYSRAEFFQWPKTWPSHKRIGLWIISVGALAAAPVMGASALAALAKQDDSAALVRSEWAVGLAMAGIFLIGTCVNRRRRFSPPRQFHDPAHGAGIKTGIRAWPRILLVPLLPLIAVGMYQGRSVFEHGRRAIPAPVLDVIIALLVFATVSMLLVLLPSVRREQGVALFPDGVSLCYGFTAHHIPWEAVRAVAADEGEGGRGQRYKQLSFQLLLGAQISSVRLLPGFSGTRLIEKRDRTFLVDPVDTDPTLLFNLCGFYLSNPELRHELASGEAIARALRAPQARGGTG